MDEYYAFDPSGGSDFDWNNLINRGFTLAGDIWGQSSHPFQDDPRYQQPRYQQPVYTTQGGQVVTANQGGAGIHLSTQTMMLIAGGILIFMVARRR
jgi:hypothetical protein